MKQYHQLLVGELLTLHCLIQHDVKVIVADLFQHDSDYETINGQRKALFDKIDSAKEKYKHLFSWNVSYSECDTLDLIKSDLNRLITEKFGDMS